VGWTVEGYQDSRGRRPVEDFILGLPEKHQGRIAWTVELPKEYGLQLTLPYARHLRGRLWELRVSAGPARYRIIYFAHAERRFILLHGFTKKTRRTPRQELATAERRMVEFLEREGGEELWSSIPPAAHGTSS